MRRFHHLYVYPFIVLLPILLLLYLGSVEMDSIRPFIRGYDRLIAIGDMTWDDYEVTVPITIHGIDPSGYASPSNGSIVGILIRWTGQKW